MAANPFPFDRFWIFHTEMDDWTFSFLFCAIIIIIIYITKWHTYDLYLSVTWLLKNVLRFNNDLHFFSFSLQWTLCRIRSYLYIWRRLRVLIYYIFISLLYMIIKSYHYSALVLCSLTALNWMISIFFLPAQEEFIFLYLWFHACRSHLGCWLLFLYLLFFNVVELLLCLESGLVAFLFRNCVCKLMLSVFLSVCLFVYLYVCLHASLWYHSINNSLYNILFLHIMHFFSIFQHNPVRNFLYFCFS